ncbi:sigma 54-interacting transcriptional regulator [Pendulispora albinea]|uniref:Sigma 54-interacting transcriptional regulator n=1 Tax=Pendulispora albinea TaxID=2741071 RepID=A0ABZ2LQV6_9BACT
MSRLDDGTLSIADDAPDAGAGSRGAHLFLVLESSKPLAPPVRIALEGMAQVVFGRGSSRAIGRQQIGTPNQLSVRMADPWLSSTHARLTYVLRRWVLEDAGSKNGCIVQGVRKAQAQLVDGDIIELGYTFFIFREDLAHEPGDPAIFEAPRAEGGAAGKLSTLIPSLERSFTRLASVAKSTVSVLIEGETGTGKEVIARNLHEQSDRRGDFVAINCGALPRDLVEGELFGYRRGAFSGATEDRPGLLRSADRGTLFLDEIGDLPAPSQAALLRVLQEREVRPVGATRPVPVDLRVVAATHRPLERMVENGTFRADLFARLAGYRIELPPLAMRREDLGVITGTILRELAPERAQSLELAPRAARALLYYPWPGNVRELEKCLESALILVGEGTRIELEHLPGAVQAALESTNLLRRSSEGNAEREKLVTLLREHKGNIAAVARTMGKARMQIQRWLKRHQIDPESFRK